MADNKSGRVAIVDYGMGNLFSVKHACENFGMDAVITSSRKDITEAEAVIVPGVGAFGDAVASLKRLDLFDFLIDCSRSFKPFVGICLGMQLLMDESSEFGTHRGLGVIKGSVVHLGRMVDAAGRQVKVPQVGWNRICRERTTAAADPWRDTLLDGLPDGAFMYFVHSFYVCPDDPGVVLSKTSYGNIEFCSSLQQGNIFACQFHPERSGLTGMNIYRNLAKHIAQTKQASGHV
jgi:imidazole glycerol-phosphate synthase subunit HisH